MKQLLPFSVPEGGIITGMPEATSKKDTEQHPPQPGRRPGRTLSRDLVVSIVLVVAAVFAMIVSFT